MPVPVPVPEPPHPHSGSPRPGLVRWGVLRTGLVITLLLASSPFTSRGSAQTVADIAARGACSTAGLEGISRQLAEAQGCLLATPFVEFVPHPNISIGSRVHPFLQGGARDALRRAADRVALTINSAFRTVADQYVLYNSGGCGVAASPGRSNHQSGRAVDVNNWSAARTALQNEGCVWFGSSDAVHFDCPGDDRRSDAILAFQMLWNINNPGDRLAEDGVYGPMTDSRLGRTPAAGFPMDGCTCTPACDGNTAVAADCSRTDCGADTCVADGGSARCEAPAVCPPTGTSSECVSATEVRTCTEGVESTATCPDGQMCFDGLCLGSPCDGVTGNVCVDAMTLAMCDAGTMTGTMSCPDGCVGGAGVARCAMGIPDAGPIPDTGPMGEDASTPTFDTGPVVPTVGRVVGGCACRTTGDAHAFWATLLLAALTRRRRRA